MADADEVVERITPRPGVAYTALWLNDKGFERALKHDDRLALTGTIQLCTSEKFLKRNQNRTMEQQLAGAARHRRDVQGARHRGRARQHDGGVRLQFRGRYSGRARGFAGRANSRRGEGARRHAANMSRSPTPWRGRRRFDQARGRGVARALARSRHRAAPARHARHGDRQCLCRTGNGRDALRLPRSPGSAAARSPATRAPPAMSAPRISCSCATKWASRPASISTR